MPISIGLIPSANFAIKHRVENIVRLNSVTPQVFPITQWNLLKACAQVDEAQAYVAISEVCQSYWRPVYVCIRHRGYSVEDAQDLTQDFFVRLLKGKYLKHLDPSKGKFRSYLSVAMQNFLHDRWRRWTWPRGRGAVHISLDAHSAEIDYQDVLTTHATPEFLYERRWAQTVFQLALRCLRIEMVACRQEILFSHFDTSLLAGTRNFSHSEAAVSLKLSSGALHASLYRWRQRLEVLLRQEIGRTVLTKSEIDDEMRYLVEILS